MDEGLKKLSEIGVQKIYEDTHISRPNIEAILNGTYKGMGKVQILGFISILEREYQLDLSQLKEAYTTDEPKVVVKPKPASAVKRDSSEGIKPKNWLIVAVLIAIVLTVAVITGWDDEEEELLPVAENSVMADGTAADEQLSEIGENMQSIEPSVAEASQMHDFPAVDDANDTESAEPSEPEKAAAPEYFSIIPKAKLWMGIIDLTTHKRSVKTTRYMVELNASKPWLLVFGHGLFSIESGDEKLDFKRQSKVRILFEDGMPFEIDKAEFKARNGGKNW